MVCSCPG
ncbi:hypothetical protein VCCP1047_1723, partial [Vibrio cholerae CP1047(20)]